MEKKDKGTNRKLKKEDKTTIPEKLNQILAVSEEKIKKAEKKEQKKEEKKAEKINKEKEKFLKIFDLIFCNTVTETLEPGSSAYVRFNAETGQLEFGIPAGLKGEKGEQGLSGEKGIKGEKGEQGPAGEKGIKGEKGEQGIQGPMGPQGPVGPQGPIGISG